MHEAVGFRTLQIAAVEPAISADVGQHVEAAHRLVQHQHRGIPVA